MKSSVQRRTSTIVEVVVTTLCTLGALCDVVYSQPGGKSRLPLDVISLWIGIPVFWTCRNLPKWCIGASSALIYNELFYLTGLNVLSVLHLICVGLCLVIIVQTLRVAQENDEVLLGSASMADGVWKGRDNDAIAARTLLIFGWLFLAHSILISANNRQGEGSLLNDTVGGPALWCVKSVQLLAKGLIRWTSTDRLLLNGMTVQCSILFAEKLLLLPLNKTMLNITYSWGELAFLVICNAIVSAPLIL